jgi:predicted small lipoprotein YifL
MDKSLRIAIIIGSLACFGLAGCGVKGPLEKPADAPKDEVGPHGEKPHKPFILDRLIQ